MAKKVEAPEAPTQDGESVLKKIHITPDMKVSLAFDNSVELPPEGDEESSQSIKSEYTVKSRHKPHKDFIAAMKELREPAFALYEIMFEKTELHKWAACGLSISGSLDNENAKVTVTLMKQSKFTKELAEYTAGPVALFDTTYEKRDEFIKSVRKVVKEAYLYLGGKHEGNDQLAIFKR